VMSAAEVDLLNSARFEKYLEQILQSQAAASRESLWIWSSEDLLELV
jgi:hypothetical protein